MKVLAVHNYYKTRGGEDQLFEDECKLLESKGHQVKWYTKDSQDIPMQKLVQVAYQTVWNRQSNSEVRRVIRDFKPDVMHSVNTFPLFSPSIFYAAQKENVPVVATIQNYRYFCAQSMCFRDGKSCEDCLGKIPWRAVKNKCYKNSYAGSAVVAGMQILHRGMKSWQKKIDVVCLASQFSKNKLVAAGLHEEKIIVKPNFAPTDPGIRNGKGNYAVFVGRLASEKGLDTLVDAWMKFSENNDRISLKIVGDGPDSSVIEEGAKSSKSVEYLGRLPNQEVYDVVGNAACLIFPSTGYESLPKTLIESMAVGTPVIGSAIGSIPEIVKQGETGLLYKAGDDHELAGQLEKFFQISDDDRQTMRKRCREEFLQRFTSEANYTQLMSIYDEAIRRFRSKSKWVESKQENSSDPNPNGVPLTESGS